MPITGKDIERFFRGKKLKVDEVAYMLGIDSEELKSYFRRLHPPIEFVKFMQNEFGYEGSPLPTISLSEDIRRFIKSKGLTQEEAAEQLGISRHTFIRNLQKENIPDSFLERLHSVFNYERYAWSREYTVVPKSAMIKPEAEEVGSLSGGIIEQNKAGNEFIEIGNGQYIMLVPLIEDYAQAGYTSGWADKEFVDELPKHTIIVSQKHKGLYRAFRVRGISMDDGTTKSICDDDIVTGRAIDKIHWNSRFHLHKFTDYIIVHKEGVIIKTIVEHDVEAGIITCRSRNPDKEKFPDFEIKLQDTVEILNVVQVDRPWK